jgi:biopolymer transport protein ExbD
MRRFSQRNSLVTLRDINITPLLDLAFVLLIIFVITTPLLEQGMDLRLPEGGRSTARIERENIQTVELDRTGRYMVNRRVMTLDQLEQTLVLAFKANHEMVVSIRADQESMVKYLYPVIDRCTRNGITRLSLRTEPPRRQ